MIIYVSLILLNVVSFFFKNKGKRRFVVAFKLVIGLCYFSPLPWAHSTFGLKSCICSTIDSFRLFLHSVSSHHYLYHRQHMDPMCPSSRSRKSVGVVKIKLCASLESQRIHFTSQWKVLKNPRDHARDRKQRRLHLALIFECTFHRLIACVKLFLFSTVLPNITFLKKGFIVVQWENENSVSVVNEKKVVGAVELKKRKKVDTLVQTRVEWPFMKLQFWKFVVSKNCDILYVILFLYVIKILSKNRYKGLN